MMSGQMLMAISITFSSPTGAVSCGRKPTVQRLSSVISPESGSSRPRIMLINVDLPAPFGPTSPTRSPRFNCNEASRKSSLPPKLLLILTIESIRNRLNCTGNGKTQLPVKVLSAESRREGVSEQELQITSPLSLIFLFHLLPCVARHIGYIGSPKGSRGGAAR